MQERLGVRRATYVALSVLAAHAVSGCRSEVSVKMGGSGSQESAAVVGATPTPAASPIGSALTQSSGTFAVTHTTPASEAQGVAVGSSTPVVITFSEPVKLPVGMPLIQAQTGLCQSNVLVRMQKIGPQNTSTCIGVVAGNVVVGSGGTVITILFTGLEYNTMYALTATTRLLSESGSSLASSYLVSFRTAPSGGASPVPTGTPTSGVSCSCGSCATRSDCNASTSNCIWKMTSVGSTSTSSGSGSVTYSCISAPPPIPGADCNCSSCYDLAECANSSHGCVWNQVTTSSSNGSGASGSVNYYCSSP